MNRNRRESAARCAAGRLGKKTNGSASGAMIGIHSRREASAQLAFTNGLKPSASLAAGGRRIRIGTPVSEFSNRETNELGYHPRPKLSCRSFSLAHSGFLLAASVLAIHCRGVRRQTQLNDTERLGIECSTPIQPRKDSANASDKSGEAHHATWVPRMRFGGFGKRRAGRKWICRLRAEGRHC